MVHGRIVRSGGKELALELEKKVRLDSRPRKEPVAA